MDYYITSMNNGALGYYERSEAKTLTAAKRECTRRFGGGYVEDTLVVGVDAGDGEVEIKKISAKKNYAGSKWVDIEY